MLHMAGFFPSVPKQLDSELPFAPSDRRWKPFGISINLGDSTPQAPDGPPPPAQAVSGGTPEAPAAAITVKPADKAAK